MKVMIVVTHLLGTGHLARALTLARAYAAAGDTVRVVSGGMPAPLLNAGDIEMVQLPPVRSDGVDFARLLTETGPATPAELDRRAQALVAALRGFAPDLLITELFPFGRRILRDEFEALLRAAEGLARPPLVCASIRDILAPPSKPRKAVFADEMVSRHYDAVLVHSDPALMPLEISWPVTDTLRSRLRYTGFVAPAPAGVHPDGRGENEIIVSAGGGDVGAHVYEAAAAAARLMPDRRWRLLVGGRPEVASLRIADLNLPPNAIAEPAHPAFRQMLYHAAASVSLCGYNTALDILQAGTRAVFVPFDAGNEVEQGLRAMALSRMAGITTLPRANLTPETLAATIETLLAAPPRSPAVNGFDGAAQTVRITHDLVAGR